MIRTIGCLFCLLIFCSCCFVFYYQSYSMLILPHFNTSNTLYPEISGQMSIYLKKTKLYLNLSHSVFVSVSLPVYLSVCLSLFLNEKKSQTFLFYLQHLGVIADGLLLIHPATMYRGNQHRGWIAW